MKSVTTTMTETECEGSAENTPAATLGRRSQRPIFVAMSARDIAIQMLHFTALSQIPTPDKKPYRVSILDNLPKIKLGAISPD